MLTATALATGRRAVLSVDELVDFGRGPANVPRTQAMTLRNTGTVNVEITAFEYESGDPVFSPAFTPVALVPGVCH